AALAVAKIVFGDDLEAVPLERDCGAPIGERIALPGDHAEIAARLLASLLRREDAADRHAPAFTGGSAVLNAVRLLGVGGDDQAEARLFAIPIDCAFVVVLGLGRLHETCGEVLSGHRALPRSAPGKQIIRIPRESEDCKKQRKDTMDWG